MEYEAVRDRVVSVVAETFGLKAENVALQMTRDSIAVWDSLQHTILMLRLQRRFGIAVQPPHGGIVTIEDLVNMYADALT